MPANRDGTLSQDCPSSVTGSLERLCEPVVIIDRKREVGKPADGLEGGSAHQVECADAEMRPPCGSDPSAQYARCKRERKDCLKKSLANRFRHEVWNDRDVITFRRQGTGNGAPQSTWSKDDIRVREQDPSGALGFRGAL